MSVWSPSVMSPVPVSSISESSIGLPGFQVMLIPGSVVTWKEAPFSTTMLPLDWMKLSARFPSELSVKVVVEPLPKAALSTVRVVLSAVSALSLAWMVRLPLFTSLP